MCKFIISKIIKLELLQANTDSFPCVGEMQNLIYSEIFNLLMEERFSHAFHHISSRVPHCSLEIHTREIKVMKLESFAQIFSFSSQFTSFPSSPKEEVNEFDSVGEKLLVMIQFRIQSQHLIEILKMGALSENIQIFASF